MAERARDPGPHPKFLRVPGEFSTYGAGTSWGPVWAKEWDGRKIGKAPESLRASFS